MNIAVVLAGGTGTRVGANIPKQFIEVQGKPILAYTLDNFEVDPEIEAIEVVCHKDWVDHVRKICEKYGISKLRWLTTGGETFQESTMNGIFNLKDKISPDDIVVFSNPWTFRYGELVEAYEEVQRRGIINDLEPHTTSVYLALGKRLWFSKSSGYNFKITLKEDLDKFEGLLLLKKQRKAEGKKTDW